MCVVSLVNNVIWETVKYKAHSEKYIAYSVRKTGGKNAMNDRNEDVNW